MLKGFFGRVTDEPVSFVNAPQLAEESGMAVRETATTTAAHYVNLITVRGGDHALAGTLVGLDAEARIVMVDDHAIDVPPARHMLVVRNEDRPGMIGAVSTTLGDAGINIANMAVGQSDTGVAALMVLATSSPVPAALVERLQGIEGVHSAHAVELP